LAAWHEGPAGRLVDGAVGGEGFTHGALDGSEDLRRVSEPDFLLGRVGVDVHHLGGHL
jgi:hypothetical protein